MGIESQAQIEACLNNRAITNRIADTHATGEAYNIPGTPSFIVNGRMMRWAQLNSVDKFRATLDPLLVDFEPAAETPTEAPADATDAPADTVEDAAADANGGANGSQD